MGFDRVAVGEIHAPPLTAISIPLTQFALEALTLLRIGRKVGPKRFLPDRPIGAALSGKGLVSDAWDFAEAPKLEDMFAGGSLPQFEERLRIT